MTTKIITGKEIQLDENGNLLKRNDWDRDIAEALAKEEGIDELTERHWVVIEFMQKAFHEKGDSPSIRKLTKESGVSTKELYTLFPNGPAKKAALIAGLPKPKGCI